jgi:hypothetical protein
MKILLFWLLVFCFNELKSQEIVPGINANNRGIAVQVNYEEMFKEGEFIFGPRVGINWHPLNPNASYFYWQNVVEYKGFFFSPFWLRRYDKSIGYQIPTSVGYRRKTEIAQIEIWGNYVYHARSFDAHILITPKKRWKLNYGQ